jgi:DNA-directed RNA polymerase subunit beta
MTAKKTTKPAKKAGAKVSPVKIKKPKIAPKPKKTVKPVKKITPKKVVKKGVSKPVKKSAPKKVVKKTPPKAKKVSKPIKVAKKTKKITPTKVIKKVSKPVKESPKKVEKKVKVEKVKKEKITKPTKAKKEVVPKVSKRDVPMAMTIRSARVEKPTHGALYVRSGRHFFTEDRSIVEMPELIAAQLDSYSSFLDYGLQEALESVFPISDFSEERVEIHFKGMELEEPRYSPKECRRKNLNYESYLRVKLQMLNKETGEIKEDTVFMGGIPLMTAKGTFIINGVERVVVHQIIKADGISFEADAGIYTAKIKPRKGAWLEFSVDKRGVITVRIDKKRKMPATTLLRAFGLENDAAIIKAFSGDKDMIAKFLQPSLDKDKTKNQVDAWHALYKLIRPGDLGTDERVEDLFRTTFYNPKRFDLGEVARLKMARKLGVNDVYEGDGRFLSTEDLVETLRYLMKLQLDDPTATPDDIDRLDNRRIRSVGELVQEKFIVGLARMERIAKDRMTVLNLDESTARSFINHRPVEAVVKEFYSSSQLSQFMDQSNPLSELAHKRRISAMGPGGLTRERASFEVRDVHPTQYGRICPIATPEGPNIGLVLHFASFSRVDKYGFLQTPYRKVAHFVKNDGKSAVNRITLEDVVDAKGKVIVPEKTLMTAAHADALKKNYKEEEILVRGYMTDEYEYVDAYVERDFTIAEANSPIDVHGNFSETRLGARQNSEATIVYVRDITHIDVSPKQIVSETTSLIPFLEHDDATRAEMGSNMMRQAVPLVHSTAPIVGTGNELEFGYKSGYCVRAEDNGKVLGVDAKHVTVMYDNGEKKTYELLTFERSNHDMQIHQYPRVSHGQSFLAGDVLVDGHSMENGELALGHNLRVAYMPWNGYNFEDAVILNSRLVENDMFTSVSINEYTLDVRETKLWPESTTNDIPNVSSAKLRDLDENGIVRIGAFVKGGDILVGKITPKGEQELSPEERLLRAIFGDKSKDVKDSSLYIPSGSGGKVIDVQILRKEEGDNLATGVFQQVKVYVAQTRKIEVGDKMAGRHGNKGIVARIVPPEDMPHTADGHPVDIILNPLGVVSRMNIGQVLEAHLGEAARRLGIKVATPVLNGVTIETIHDLMKQANMDLTGKVQLYDGQTGEPFQEQTMLGTVYMLKLHHLVEDKIHARAVGPYSMITQQPLGGKAQNGGQRFGEMECWAIQGYGAANILQEILTIKSDDITGRTQAYRAIVKNEQIKRPSVPESFHVMIKELQALGLKMELLEQGEVNERTDIYNDRMGEVEVLSEIADTASSAE